MLLCLATLSHCQVRDGEGQSEGAGGGIEGQKEGAGGGIEGQKAGARGGGEKLSPRRAAMAQLLGQRIFMRTLSADEAGRTVTTVLLLVGLDGRPRLYVSISCSPEKTLVAQVGQTG
jgi:hypothetical protein